MTADLPLEFTNLAALFTAMDKTWDRVAARYGFRCTGCEDNCCRSLFFHHTHVEKAYLLWGFSLLEEADREEIRGRAARYCQETFSGGQAVSRKIPCPLLFDGKCRLYVFRPMICRMHGLPHELHKPGHPPLQGPGCAAGQFENQSYVPFDRTPFYREMAGIELAFRTGRDCPGKTRETVAQMLLPPESRVL